MTVQRAMGNGPRVCLTMVVFSTLIAHGPWLMADVGFLAQQAQLAWDHREEAGQTEQSMNLWQQAYKAEPNHPEYLIPLVRAANRACRHTSNQKEKQRVAEDAVRFGENAVAKNASSSEAYAEYATALGQWAQCHKGIHSVKVVRQSIDMMKKSIELNPRNPTPHMLLAEMYRQAPNWISKGDKQKALEQARLAVQYGGAYALNHVVLAKSLLDTGHKAEAIRELQAAIQLKAPPDAIPETKSDQEDAREMLKKLGASEAATPAEGVPLAEKSCDHADGVCKDPAVQGTR